MWIQWLTIIQESVNPLTEKIFGVYKVDFSDDSSHVFVINGNDVKVINHGLEESTLSKISDELANKILYSAEQKRISGCY